MKNFLFLLFTLVGLGQENEPIFLVTGTDWTLTVESDQLHFVGNGSNFTSPYTVLNHADGTKLIAAHNKTELQVYIKQQTCSMGADFSWGGKATLLSHRKKTMWSGEGCAIFKPDYRLSKVWRLTSLSGRPATALEFGGELPYLDILTRNGMFSGYAGCNRIIGKITFATINELSIGDIIATKMICTAENRESEFLAILRKVNRFAVSGGQLILYEGSNEQVRFEQVL